MSGKGRVMIHLKSLFRPWCLPLSSLSLVLGYIHVNRISLPMITHCIPIDPKAAGSNDHGLNF